MGDDFQITVNAIMELPGVRCLVCGEETILHTPLLSEAIRVMNDHSCAVRILRQSQRP